MNPLTEKLIYDIFFLRPLTKGDCVPWTDYAIMAIAGFLVVSLAIQTFRYRKDMWLIFVEVWRPVRPRIVIEAFLLFAVTLSTAVGLIKAAPWTAYGWLNLLLRKGGNLLVAPVLAMSDSPRFGLRLIPILFLLLLFFAMPTLAFAEEMIFRSKIRSKAGLFRQALLFGPAHLLAGVPVAVGAAIILVGFFLGYKFMNTKRKRARMWAKRLHLPKNNKHIVEVAVNEAVYNSTMYHTVLNTIALSIALVLCISKLF